MNQTNGNVQTPTINLSILVHIITCLVDCDERILGEGFSKHIHSRFKSNHQKKIKLQFNYPMVIGYNWNMQDRYNI